MRASIIVIVVLFARAAAGGQELLSPVRLEAGGKPIDVEGGYAAPFVCDMDRDGKNDLLVGQFGWGKLRIYKNLGENGAPRFGGFTWLQADGEDASVPSW